MFQASSRTPKGRTFRALSIDIENSSFHAFWLGIENRPWKSMDILRKIQQVFEMAENAEKPGFTFFAFLPPYIGVSSFLVYPQGKNFSRSIDWYRKFFISCLLARYRKLKIHRHIIKISTGVWNGWKCRKTRFYVFCLFTSLYWGFRVSHALQTIELEEIYRLISKILHFIPSGSVLGCFAVSYENFIASPMKF